ncbi:zinc ribbon domain-containing protein [Gordonia sp. TBRC 11910]|uniref:Zinc ribbon domain-containing protein n=1 Tax=Gordonia asplenii TaxID=2725283 RepID=A0A848KXI1_9ACTN|nr:zinc ribbon domain-containing protein [Gordonia asplenii]NMO03474.1 zinc ribbon domain-containing protein [Gordonia asplenii]
MSDNTGFTGHVSDLSNQNGFQWEFHCGRCSTEFRSDFAADNVSRFRGLVRGVSDLIGGQAYRVSSAADSFGGMFSNYGGASSAKDKAYARAVEAVKQQFKHCGGCGSWVCSSCWNGRVGMCQNCSPLAEHDLARAQASARGYQMRDAAAEQDWMRGQQVNVPVTVNCPSCGSHTTGGKFCGACGSSLQATANCRSCGSPMQPGAVFCTNCGHTG